MLMVMMFDAGGVNSPEESVLKSVEPLVTPYAGKSILHLKSEMKL